MCVRVCVIYIYVQRHWVSNSKDHPYEHVGTQFHESSTLSTTVDGQNPALPIIRNIQ